MRFTLSTLVALCVAAPALATITVPLDTNLDSGSITLFPSKKIFDLSTIITNQGTMYKHVVDLSFDDVGSEHSVRFDIIDNQQAPGQYYKCEAYMIKEPVEAKTPAEEVTIRLDRPLAHVKPTVPHHEQEISVKCEWLKNGEE